MREVARKLGLVRRMRRPPPHLRSRASSSSNLGDPGGEEAVDAVVEALRGARSVLVITGAGISADSGLPTCKCRIPALCLRLMIPLSTMFG